MLSLSLDKEVVKMPDVPDVIPIDGGPYESTIVTFLERAQEKAKDLESGARFQITLEDPPVDVWFAEITGPIMMRAFDYGLVPGASVNLTFEFTKL
jgi:hypothetical protein